MKEEQNGLKLCFLISIYFRWWWKEKRKE